MYESTSIGVCRVPGKIEGNPIIDKNISYIYVLKKNAVAENSVWEIYLHVNQIVMSRPTFLKLVLYIYI